jgi:hypothetical protein
MLATPLDVHDAHAHTHALVTPLGALALLDAAAAQRQERDAFASLLLPLALAEYDQSAAADDAKSKSG